MAVDLGFRLDYFTQEYSVHRCVRRRYPADEGPKQGTASTHLREDGCSQYGVQGRLLFHVILIGINHVNY